jgi:hypothetical protein
MAVNLDNEVIEISRTSVPDKKYMRRIANIMCTWKYCKRIGELRIKEYVNKDLEYRKRAQVTMQTEYLFHKLLIKCRQATTRNHYRRLTLRCTSPSLERSIDDSNA